MNRYSSTVTFCIYPTPAVGFCFLIWSLEGITLSVWEHLFNTSCGPLKILFGTFKAVRTRGMGVFEVFFVFLSFFFFFFILFFFPPSYFLFYFGKGHYNLIDDGCDVLSQCFLKEQRFKAFIKINKNTKNKTSSIEKIFLKMKSM